MWQLLKWNPKLNDYVALGEPMLWDQAYRAWEKRQNGGSFKGRSKRRYAIARAEKINA